MINKLTLVSNHICYGMLPKVGDEAEQRLTINSKGQVWFSGKVFKEDLSYEFTIGRKIRKTVNSEFAKEILNDVSKYFSNKEPFFVTDVGDYGLTLFSDNGTKQDFRGPLFCQDNTMQEICDRIRVIVGIDNMFLFDGNVPWGEDDEEE